MKDFKAIFAQKWGAKVKGEASCGGVSKEDNSDGEKAKERTEGRS